MEIKSGGKVLSMYVSLIKISLRSLTFLWHSFSLKVLVAYLLWNESIFYDDISGFFFKIRLFNMLFTPDFI